MEYSNQLKRVEKTDVIDIRNKNRQIAILEAITTGVCTTDEDLMEHFNLTPQQVIILKNDPNFIMLLENYSKGKAAFSFHTQIGSIIELLGHEDPNVRMRAWDRLGQYSGNIKSKGNDVNVTLNLENLVKETEKRAGALDIEFTPKT